MLRRGVFPAAREPGVRTARPQPLEGGAEDLGAIAWYDQDSDGRSHPVGQQEPNRWGLYDMLGKVIERVQDWYGGYPGGGVPQRIPKVLASA